MRRLVFASGKGGTGKTTIASAVAHEAARTMSIVLADCDVEAANLAIALGACGAHSTPFTGLAKADIDARSCTGCGACERQCRFDALAHSWDAPSGHTFRVDAYACEGCGACVPICPVGAISMKADVAGEVCSANTTVGPLAFGALFPGEDLSGKLVTEVRRRAEELGCEQDAVLTIIDGPPGVGCPATAAITNTDLLVAVTEPTLSAEHDLKRLLVLARRLTVPVVAVLNKADLSEAGASSIRSRLALEHVEIIAEVPFDPAFGESLSRMARDSTALSEGPVAEAARTIWQMVSGRVE